MSDIKRYWIVFMKDKITGNIKPVLHEHNCLADYKGHSIFKGYATMDVDMSLFEDKIHEVKLDFTV